MDSSRLLSLPTELVGWIAAACSDEALLKLRLVSKDISSKTWDAFLERFFSCRYTILTDRRSMENLVEITRHPEICKGIKHLRFSLALLYPHTCDHDLRRLESGFPKNRMERLKHRELRRVYEELYEDSQKYCQGADAIDLHMILQNLMDAGFEPPFISVTDREPDYFERDLPSGHLRLTQQLGYDRCLMGDNHMHSRPFNIVLSAMTAAWYPVQRLALGAPGHGIHFSVFRDLSLPVQNLRDLSLTFRTGHHRFFTYEIAHDRVYWLQRVKAFLNALQDATKLKSLTLTQSNLCACKEFQTVLFESLIHRAQNDQEGKFLPQLVSLRLNGFKASPTLVEEFASLKSRTLSAVTVAEFT